MLLLNNMTLSQIYNKIDDPFINLRANSGIVLIGNADKGPAMIPVVGNGSKDYIKISSIFGPDSQLSNAYLEAVSNSNSTIYLIRTNGKHRTINLKWIRLISLEAIDAYNDIEINIDEDNETLVILFPQRGIELEYTLQNKKIDDIVKDINYDAMASISPVFAEVIINGDTSGLLSGDFVPENILADGDYEEADNRILDILNYLESYPIKQIGILNRSYYDTLTQTYTIKPTSSGYLYTTKLINWVPYFEIQLEDSYGLNVGDTIYIDENLTASIDFISNNYILVPGNLGAIDVVKTVVKKDYRYLYDFLSEFCTRKAANLAPCIITIGDNSIVNIKDRALDFTDKLSTEIAVSQYINIVLASFTFSNLSSLYTSNLVPTICSAIDNASNYDNISGTEIKYTLVDKIVMTNADVVELASKGFISTYKKIDAYKIYSGVNLIQTTNKAILIGVSNSYTQIPQMLSKISNVMLVQDIIYDIGNSIEGLLVDTTNTNIRNAIEYIMSTKYNIYINSYDVNVSNILDRTVRDFIVSLSIMPIGEIERFTLNVGVR